MTRIIRCCAVAVLLAFVGFNVLGAQDTYRLVVPSEPSLKSSAAISGNRLTITSGGSSFTYTRNPSLDSKDRKYEAYYSVAAKQYVRFPVSGSGKMMIGTTSGLSLTWRESKMVVEKASGLSGIGSGQSSSPSALPTQLNQLELADGSRLIGFVDGDGSLRMFQGKDQKWQPLKVALKGKLVSNAPIALIPQKGTQIPDVLTVDSQGRLTRIVAGTSVVTVSKKGDPYFSPGSRIAVADDYQSCFGCDQQGRIWQYDIASDSFINVENRKGLVLPGADLEYIDNQLFVIDRFGNLAGYTKASTSWSKPFLVEKGFRSGGIVASWRQAGLVASRKAIVSINRKGRPYIAYWQKNSWIGETIDNLSLTPGAPIGVSHRDGDFFISFINKKGNWINYRRTTPGVVTNWVPHTVSSGFTSGGYVLVDSVGVNAFSIDRSGQLIAAHYHGGGWECFLCSPALRLAPRLRQREIVPNPPIPPAEIILRNDHKETLVVRVFDKRDGMKKFDVVLKPSASTKIKVDRDSGAVARESITIIGPRGGGIQDTRVTNLPPQILYDIVVFENKVTSQFFDRTKNKSNKPDSEQKSLVSVGVFPVPPGEQMRNGSSLNAFDSAKRQKNPGAAALFGPIKQ